MEITDQKLVERCMAGDTSAFAQLVTRYQTLVCSIAFSITSDFNRSEDVGQDAFVAAWKQMPELSDGCKFKSWICQITRNLAHNAMRCDRKFRQGGLSEPVTDGGLSPSEQAEHMEERALVQAALARLPVNYREPLVLFYRKDQSIAEVANELDLTPGVVKQRLSRGRRLLREEVTSLIEQALKRSAPTSAFTIAVLAALPGIAPKSAAAATVGSATALATAASTAGKASTFIGPFLGSLVGIGGAALGTWTSWSMARFQRERDFIYQQAKLYFIAAMIFSLPFLAMVLGWRPRELLGTQGYLFAYGVWMCTFFVANAVWIVHYVRRSKQIADRVQDAGDVQLPSSHVSSWISRWEGRRWQSKWSLLGHPLVHIAFSDPGGQQSATLNHSQGMARGWIAVGDHARGRLVAVGNIALAPIAMGTMSAGILSIGVVSVGIVSVSVISIAVLALGVISLGGWSFGGAVAVGYLAAGPVALGWNAASGAVAFAFTYADGAEARALHVGDGAAKDYFAGSDFFGHAERLFDWTMVLARVIPSGWFVVFVPLVVLAVMCGAYRRRDLASQTPDSSQLAD